MKFNSQFCKSRFCEGHGCIFNVCYTTWYRPPEGRVWRPSMAYKPVPQQWTCLGLSWDLPILPLVYAYTKYALPLKTEYYEVRNHPPLPNLNILLILLILGIYHPSLIFYKTEDKPLSAILLVFPKREKMLFMITNGPAHLKDWTFDIFQNNKSKVGHIHSVFPYARAPLNVTNRPKHSLPLSQILNLFSNLFSNRRRHRSYTKFKSYTCKSEKQV